MLRKGKRSVGLFIGSKDILLVSAHISGSSQIFVDNIGVAELPSDAFKDDNTVNSPAVSRVIRELLSETRIKTREISLTISIINNVIMRSLVLPSMPKREMLEALKGEVENYAILSSDDPIIDFQTIDQNLSGAGQKSEILFAAAPKSLIRSYIAAVESANLKVSTIEVMPVSVLRALTHISTREETEDQQGKDEENYMVVSIEENGGIVYIAKGQKIKFIHNLEMNKESIENGESLNDLSEEIRSSIEYYQSVSPQDNEIKNVYLFLNGTKDEYIISQLNEHLDIPVLIPPIPGNIDFADTSIIANHILPAYSAIGSAIHTKGDEFINLLPAKNIGSVNLKKQLAVSALIMFSTALLFICADFVIKAKIGAVKGEIAEIKHAREIKESQSMPEMPGIEADVSKLKSQIDLIKATISSIDRVKWVDVLPEIGVIIPKSMWLSSLSWSQNSNVVFSGSALTYESVFKFMDTLNTSSYFDSPKLVFIRKSGSEGSQFVQFEIRCGIKSEKLNGKEKTIESAI